jgi:L,D-peptidoglycan transpeptidase YkuD (ErfK/YbiS/YcfS/YnhG family)
MINGSRADTLDGPGDPLDGSWSSSREASPVRRFLVLPAAVLLGAATMVTPAGSATATAPDGTATAGRLDLLKRAISRKAAPTLPERMAATGDGTQLITAVSNGTTNTARDGTLTWWKKVGPRWVKVGSTAARFGTNGLSDNRVEGNGTTPTGIFTLPMAFGRKADPGTEMPWHKVNSGSWWNENSLDANYNSWQPNCPPSVCWEASTRSAHSSEHLADYDPQYNYSVVIGFNTGMVKVRPPARPSGSGIFLHVFGSGHTAGCVSVSQSALVSILRWLDPDQAPHIAIGNKKSIYGF